MTKKSATYIYTVGDTTMVDTEPFGSVWKTVKAIHDETNLPIYRKVIKVEICEEEYGHGIFVPIK